MNSVNLLDRFAAKVATDDNDCLIWLGGHTQTRPNSDYGIMRVDGRTRVAHHVAWFLEHGRWPSPDMELDHLCRVTLCVNVHHLEEVTRRVNNQRRQMGWIQRSDPTLCKAGLHPWTPSNLYHNSGGPTCKSCSQQRAKERYRRRRKVV